jgi:hypothetical protein
MHWSSNTELAKSWREDKPGQDRTNQAQLLHPLRELQIVTPAGCQGLGVQPSEFRLGD